MIVLFPLKKHSRNKERFIAPSYVLMVMSGMIDVVLVVIAVDYSQQLHCCEVATAHAFKGTTNMQLTGFESLSTRT